MKHNNNAIASISNGPRLPSGKQLGNYSDEGEKIVWIRRVSVDRHLLRIRNAWTINRPILEQIQQAGVDVIRYVEGSDDYEVDLSEFLQRAEIFKNFANGEDAFALSRAKWTTHSSGEPELLPLFVVNST